MLPLVEKICLICEKPFLTRIPRKKYCDDCQYLSVRINQIAKKKGIVFEEAKQVLKRRLSRLSRKKCLDCGMPFGDVRWVRCSECAVMKRAESDRRRNRMRNMRFKCLKCGKPTTFWQKHPNPPKMCEKHRRAKDAFLKRLLYWHKQDLKNENILR